MKNVLSIQSHVVYGHAGNSAAVFPMQRLGVQVWPIHTVQFSNHTQYGQWQGQALRDEDISLLPQGLAAIGVLSSCDAVLTGYLGSVEQAARVLDAVAQVKAANPAALYLCDPVMSHDAKRCVVDAGIERFLQREMPRAADILAPNHTELEKLAGGALRTFDEALEACRSLLELGPSVILVKHLEFVGKPADRFDMLAVTREEAWHGHRPLYPFDLPPVGVGDLLSGIFLARLLQSGSVRTAFEHALAASDGVMRLTRETDSYELQLILAQDEIARPSRHYPARAV